MMELGLESEIDDNAIHIKEMKPDIKLFKEQFTDFQGKSASNNVEVINKIENM